MSDNVVRGFISMMTTSRASSRRHSTLSSAAIFANVRTLVLAPFNTSEDMPPFLET